MRGGAEGEGEGGRVESGLVREGAGAQSEELWMWMKG